MSLEPRDGRFEGWTHPDPEEQAAAIEDADYYETDPDTQPGFGYEEEW